MKRVIKFRAQDIASNKWLYGDIRHHKNDVSIFEQGGNRGEQVKPDTVGQFTGFYDVDGNEVYEGDVAEILNKEYISIGFCTNHCVVEFIDGGFIFVMIGRKSKKDADKSVYIHPFHVSFKVVGNKYDNPELIKEGEK